MKLFSLEEIRIRSSKDKPWERGSLEGADGQTDLIVTYLGGGGVNFCKTSYARLPFYNFEGFGFSLVVIIKATMKMVIIKATMKMGRESQNITNLNLY